MKLLSLHVTAFGGISNRDLTFSEGLTEIIDRNGAGKSTLAAFIKMMLYGLEGGARATPEENEHRLYEPWQGGRFGGTLILSHEGRTYRIERFYERVGKAKTPQGSLTVIDLETGLATDRFGEEPGRAILGVDGPSFLRTAYLSSRAITAAKTPDISAKLGGSEGEEADMAQYEKALKLLKNKRNEIRTTKKQQNGQKLLDISERQLRDVEAAIEAAMAARTEAETEKAAAEIAEKKLAELNECLSALRQQKEALEKAEALAAADKTRRKELEAECASLTETLGRIVGHFPNGVPSERQMEELEDRVRDYRRLLAKVNAHSEEPKETLLPTAAEMAALRNAVSDRKRAEEAAANTPPPIPQKRTKRPLILGICAAAAAAVGVTLLFLAVLPAVLALVAAVGLAVAAYLLARGERTAQTEAERRAAEEAAANLAALRNDAEAARELLAKFGLTADADMQDLDDLQERAFAARHAEKEVSEAQENAAALHTEIIAALSLYRDLPKADDLSVPVSALKELCARHRAAEDALSEKRRALSHLPAPKTDEAAQPSPHASWKAEIEAAEATRQDLTAEVAVHRQKEEDRRKAADGLCALLDRREALLSEIAEHEARLSILDHTARFLEEARAAYEERYLGGIRRHIGTYTRRLLQETAGEAQIDLDLQLSFLQDGEAHGAYYLSTGLRAITDVCLRLALTDALYPEAPPPLILDDPFVALDEENLATALSLLHELSTDRQILYLTCHPSRSTTS